jgi:hypothetical protein
LGAYGEDKEEKERYENRGEALDCELFLEMLL